MPLTKYRILRLIVQVVFLFILNAAVFNFVDFVLPIPLPINFPLGPYSIVEGAFYTTQRLLVYVLIPFVTFAIFLLIGSLVGRLFCAWVCPFGTIQDIISLLKPKKYTVSRNTDRQLYETVPFFYLSLVLIYSAVIGFSAIIGGNETYQQVITQFGVLAEVPGAAFDPSSTLFGAIPYWLFIFETFPTDLDSLLALDILLWIRLLILLISVILPLYFNRFWCRYVCPTGYIMGKIGENSLIGLNRNMAKCTDCKACDTACPMGIRITELPAGRIRHQNCIMCLDCQNVCPEDAITLTIKD